MSIFGSMNTAVSGMNAQTNRLSTVADNIANSSTTGYKGASTSFSTLVLPSTSGSYNSGGVDSKTTYSISQQGNINSTTNTSNLAISGSGFFIVSDAAGTPFLTRAGDFTADSQGNLVNSAGFSLMGYSYESGSPAVVVNGFDGLVPINVAQSGLVATATTSGSFSGNLNSNAPEVTTGLPSSNTTPITADTTKTSLIGYDSYGNAVQYDYYYTKTANDEWEVAVYRKSDAATGGTSSFPYAAGPLATGTMTFDTDGKITSGQTLDVVDGTQTIQMDLSGFSQLASSFAATGNANGQKASPISGVTIEADGTVYANYEDGSTKPLYRIPLADVASPDNLTVLSGNVYAANGQSGVTVTGFPQSNGLGSIQSGAVEGSNVDLAGQLTEMIQAQRIYTANSKVFQTGSDIMDVLVNLKR